MDQEGQSNGGQQIRSYILQIQWAPKRRQRWRRYCYTFWCDLKIQPVELGNTASYEYGVWNLTIHEKMITIIGIYRPTQSEKNVGIATFLDEISDHLIELLSNYREVMIIGDINIHGEVINNPDKIAYNDMLASFNLQQMVTCITYESGHTLDHIILREGNNLNIEEPTQGHKISDHWMIKLL